MTDTVRETIVQAAKAALAQISAANTERNRRNPISDDDVADKPLLVLFEGDEQDATEYSGEDAYALSLYVQGAVRGSDDAAAAAANNLRGLVVQKFFADRTLGGKCRDLTIDSNGEPIGIPVDSAEIESFIAAFTVSYATKEGDPFTPAN
jgi:hypothetical protein